MILVLVTACAGPTAPDRPVPSSATASTTASVTAAATPSAAADTGSLQTDLDAILTALRAGDRAAYAAATSTLDPAFAVVSRQLWDNLTTLPITDLSLLAGPARRHLSPERAAILPGGWVQEVRAGWRYAGESAPAQHQLWLTFVPAAGQARLAGIDDGPGSSAVPLWLTGAVLARPGPGVLVVGADPARWLSPAESAVREVASALPTAWRRGLTRRVGGPLVVEVPSDARRFERLLGAAPGTYAGIAAVAWPAGAGAGAAVRVLVNPTLSERLTADGRRVLLTHEATHVATHSTDSPAPLWLVEGFADYVAYRAYPAGRDAALGPARRLVRRTGAPRALPADDAFGPRAADLDTTYALSWLACRFVAERWGEDRLLALYASADEGQPIETALRASLGIGTETFTARWRAHLAALTRT